VSRPGAPSGSGWTRRRLLGTAVTASAAFLVGGLELVDHRVLPGKHYLDEIDGTCSVHVPKETFAVSGPTASGRFFSLARRREVGYTIAYPPGHRPGDRLPLVLYLHAHGGNHRSALGSVPPARALAGNGISAFAIAVFDGGNLYWNPHPGDDPMGMIVDEIIPMCRRHGLGTEPGMIAAVGESMGGYGAILLAERHPSLLAAVAAISPAIWTSYAQAVHVDRSAFASVQDFARDDVITHAGTLAHVPLRIASGSNDPFHPGVVALARRLGPSSTVEITSGCHDTGFFNSQQQRSLQFISRHLKAPSPA